MSQINIKKLKLAPLRISFPNLLTLAKYQGEVTENYTCDFIIDQIKQADQCKLLTDAVQQAIVEGYPKGTVIPPHMRGYQQGNERNLEKYPMYKDHLTFKASSRGTPISLFYPSGKRIPVVGQPVVMPDGSIETKYRFVNPEDAKIFYAGAWCVPIISLWTDKPGSNWAKRVHFNLLGLQFHHHDTPFTSQSSADEDDFDSFESSDPDAIDDMFS